MNASISRRLAIMFAAASFMMISITSLATYGLLKRELGRHQMTELTTRWDFNQFLVARASDRSKWPHVRDDLSRAPHKSVSYFAGGMSTGAIVVMPAPDQG